MKKTIPALGVALAVAALTVTAAFAVHSLVEQSRRERDRAALARLDSRPLVAPDERAGPKSDIFEIYKLFRELNDQVGQYAVSVAPPPTVSDDNPLED